MTRSTNFHDSLEAIMHRVENHFHPDTWSLLLANKDQNELYYAVAVASSAELLRGFRLKFGEGIAGYVAKTGEKIIVPDIMTDPRYARNTDEHTKWQSMICIPIRSKLRTLGVIQLINVPFDRFTDERLTYLQWFCEEAALVIEYADREVP